ncbi:E3 ubiquitin-protein ligase rnf213-alpha-like [Watersipora subatra]|uniref:E3 ubiquitin-protein ligase rnf213-alpha-like n=1 Tax=Watersipora subatra TaxID=2589382 RepID=UPI00355AE36D
MLYILVTRFRQQPLIEQLTGIWDGFVKLTDETILNFLSVEHLAFILHRLRNMICSKKKDRTMPFYMERGRPHLIAASHRMKYQLVLSLYEFDRVCPHPTRNEVLLCTSSTRRDEVMLFLSRALKDSTSFYCVVNSHLLEHDICKEIEQTISAANEMSNVQYGLAFIYSEEVKNARIRTYLDKYLVKNVEVAPLENLKTYVSKNLTVPSSVTPTASSADPDRSYARLIRSSRAGVGKSLQKLNLCHELRVVQEVTGKDITIPIYKVIDTDNIINCLTSKLGNGYSDTPCSVIHFDIAHEVESGVDELLFNLIILRSLVNSEGVVWQAQPTQYYIIECMPCINKDRSSVHEIFDILPTITCISPEEALKKYTDELPTDSFIGFDQPTLYSREWQTVLRFLECHQDPSPKNDYWIEDVEIADPVQALQLLIQNCGLKEPSWSELRHYVYFLSDQLFKVEKSPYCLESSAPDLPGFRRFVVQFMFRMAKDFATRSLKIAEETPGAALSEATEQEDAGAMLDQLGMKRTWESVNHPYLFFNEDGETVTPLGFFAKSINVARAYSLVDCDTLEELVPDAITRELKRALDQCHLSMSENFKNLRRMDQLTKLRDVMVKKCMLYDSSITYDKSATRNNIPYFALDDDPDPNYVLTMDNAKKILAIHQRLR